MNVNQQYRKTFSESFLFLFFLLFILAFPYPYTLFPDIGSFFAGFINPVVVYCGETLLEIPRQQLISITSDSPGLYIQIVLIVALSLILALATAHYYRHRPPSWLLLGHPVCAYYLSLQLFSYGLNKLFLYQFYFPEPNTLYTPLGYLSKDILYWSSMGTSPVYSIFLGICEIIPAILLLFHKTRSTGALIAAFVLINVFMINIGFDISVKVYAAFLLFCSLKLCVPFFKTGILFSSSSTAVYARYGALFKADILNRFYPVVKSITVALILVESLYLYAWQGWWEIEHDGQDALLGAYEVRAQVQSSDSILSSDSRSIKRFFIHRKGYLIFQYQDTLMKDFKLEIDPENSLMLVQDYDSTTYYFQFSSTQFKKRKVFLLHNDSLKLWADKIALEKLPLVISAKNR